MHMVTAVIEHVTTMPVFRDYLTPGAGTVTTESQNTVLRKLLQSAKTNEICLQDGRHY